MGISSQPGLAMDSNSQHLSMYVPGSHEAVVPFMRDVFTIPTNRRVKPTLIGSFCGECEEYFFPKTGQKATCDNPFCPRSTSTALLTGKGKILSAAVMHSVVDRKDESVSSVILLEEGIKINSPLIGWEGYEYLLVPGSPVELVLQEMGLNDGGEMIIGYAFRLVTGRKKPRVESKDKGNELRTIVESEKRKKKPSKKKSAHKTLAKRATKKKIAKKKPAEKKTTKKKNIGKETEKRAAKKKSAKKKIGLKKKHKKKVGKK